MIVTSPAHMPALGYSPGAHVATQLPPVSSTAGDVHFVHCVGLVQISQLSPQAVNFHKKDDKHDNFKKMYCKRYKLINKH